MATLHAEIPDGPRDGAAKCDPTSKHRLYFAGLPGLYAEGFGWILAPRQLAELRKDERHTVCRACEAAP